MLNPDRPLARRAVLERFVPTLLLGALARTSAWAGGRPAAMERWARGLVELNASLQRGEVSVTQWQDEVASLEASVSVAEVVKALEVDALVRSFTYASRLADVADPILPPRLFGVAKRKGWFVRIFGMKKTGAIIPHVHNTMVSAHLVLSGQFHARTFDRVADEEASVVLRPSVDRVLRAGEVITMSDQRDNGHWLVAEADHSLTFDVGVVDVPASFTYRLAADRFHMINVDPLQPLRADGTLTAPVMTFEACAAKFAG